MLPDLSAAKAAHRHAADLERQILKRWPAAWQHMDRMRRDPPVPWPEWCLLPMAAAAAVTGIAGFPPPPIALVSALYAWRYSRAVYVFEPHLADRLLGQVPDAISIDNLANLPHWCVYITDSHPEFPGAGLWAYLEYDANTGRPELRLMIDMGHDDLTSQIPIPIYLDRDSITEAIAEFRVTGARKLFGDLSDGGPTMMDARMADNVDGYLGMLAYLARPEADITCVNRPGLRPVRPRSPVKDSTTWAVGYS